MLVQLRREGLRLFRQHDHGLLAGEMANAWYGLDGRSPLTPEVVLATALHDLGWRPEDRAPTYDPESRGPRDFLRVEPARKAELAAEGIDRVEELNPYAAVLVSLHQTGFGNGHGIADFRDGEELRRMELLEAMGEEAPAPESVSRDLAFLQLFDNLSLVLCLAPPDSLPESRPPWLTPDKLTVPEGGQRLAFAWEDEGSVVVDPYPFGADPVVQEIRYRPLPPGPFPSAEALNAAWEAASPRTWSIRFRPG